MPLEITPHIVIPDDELEWKFIRASGPGGQNVNKVSSAVQLRFLLPLNTSLPVGGQKSPARAWRARNSSTTAASCSSRAASAARSKIAAPRSSGWRR